MGPEWNPTYAYIRSICKSSPSSLVSISRPWCDAGLPHFRCNFLKYYKAPWICFLLRMCFRILSFCSKIRSCPWCVHPRRFVVTIKTMIGVMHKNSLAKGALCSYRDFNYMQCFSCRQLSFYAWISSRCCVETSVIWLFREYIITRIQACSPGVYFRPVPMLESSPRWSTRLAAGPLFYMDIHGSGRHMGVAA